MRKEFVGGGGESTSNFLTLTHVHFTEKGSCPTQNCHEGSNLSQVTVGPVPCQASSSATSSAGWTITKRQAPSTEVSEAQGWGVWVNPGGRCGRFQAHRAQERAPTYRPWSRTPTCQQPAPSGSGARINLIQDPEPQIVQGIRCPLGSFELPGIASGHRGCLITPTPILALVGTHPHTSWPVLGISRDDRWSHRVSPEWGPHVGHHGVLKVTRKVE